MSSEGNSLLGPGVEERQQLQNSIFQRRQIMTECLRSAITGQSLGPTASPRDAQALSSQMCCSCSEGFIVSLWLAGNSVVISKMRARFLSEREGWLDLEDEVLWAGQECTGKEGKERTPQCGLSERQEFGREEQVG